MLSLKFATPGLRTVLTSPSVPLSVRYCPLTAPMSIWSLILVGKGPPRKSCTGHIGGIFKKDQILGTLSRRACMKRLMDVSEAREIRKDRNLWKSVVSAYPSGKQA
ncbi:hypothetical protein EVAR_5150_1 [Eumeta japonica]|uniref:Uncharacterized protein n=1 Tax=Eumeta variegata TaxID=151549 RepID=A0A4C1SUM4_EUMVA|nr:hypothetical protein EVAR_5150_1 [Eumeta japonica]